VPADAKLLYTHESLTLSEVIRLVNKFSSNVMARHLLLTLAAEKAGRPATAAAGERVIAEFLASRGIVIPDLVIENGAGCPATSASTAQGLADVLREAWLSPFMPEFAASLPLSAIDGTLRRRFRSPDMEGRLRMKTGSLQDVSGARWLRERGVRRSYVTVIMLNHPGADSGAARPCSGAGELGVRTLAARLVLGPRFAARAGSHSTWVSSVPSSNRLSQR